jgi:hypothetical protein
MERSTVARSLVVELSVGPQVPPIHISKGSTHSGDPHQGRGQDGGVRKDETFVLSIR